jgi:hypothetical protein
MEGMPTPVPLITTHRNNIQLKTNSVLVTSQIETLLRSAYTTQQLREYYMNRHQWNDSTIDTIDWDILGTTLKRLPKYLHRHTLQMINYWLPVLHHPSQRTPNLRTTCPRCQLDNEDISHYHHCTHTKQHIIDNIIPKLITINEKFKTPNVLSKLINDILLPTINNTPIEENHPLILSRLLQQQSSIGWSHWVKGKWASEWIYTFNRLTNSDTGHKWSTKVLQLLWTEYHQIWLTRNNKLHQPDNLFETKRQADMLNQTIRETYELEERLNAIDRKRLMRPLDKLLNSTHRQKHIWINNNTKQLRKKAKECRKQTSSASITQYF